MKITKTMYIRRLLIFFKEELPHLSKEDRRILVNRFTGKINTIPKRLDGDQFCTALCIGICAFGKEHELSKKDYELWHSLNRPDKSVKKVNFDKALSGKN